MQPQFDLTQDPGVGICDRCERRIEREWLLCLALCNSCVHDVAPAIGKLAMGRGIKRLSELVGAHQDLRNLSLWNRKGA